MAQQIKIHGYFVNVEIKAGAWFFNCPSLDIQTKLDLADGCKFKVAVYHFFERKMQPVIANKCNPEFGRMAFNTTKKPPGLSVNRQTL